MANFIITGSSTTQHILNGENGFIGKDGSLVTSGVDAVVGSGSSELMIFGLLTAFGPNEAINFDGLTMKLVVGSTGQITTGSAFAIDAEAAQSIYFSNDGFISGGRTQLGHSDGSANMNVFNTGKISSPFTAIEINAGAGSAQIINSGEIIGQQVGINSAGSSDVTIMNSGLITASSSLIVSTAIVAASGNTTIHNTGLISAGDRAISLGDGTNLYDGTGGQVVGIILGGNGIDTIIGGDFSETVIGRAGNDIIFGKGGNDVLSGGDDRDVVRGGAGADELDGGDGAEDWIDYRGSTARVVVNLGTGQADGGDAAGDFFTGFERIIGSNLDDTLTGNSANNVIRGDGGADFIRGASGNDLIAGGRNGDILDGGNGIDTLDYRTSAAAVSINLVSNTASGGDAAGDTITKFENVIGSVFNDILIGSKTANQMTGGTGDDTFHFRSNLGPANIDTIIDFAVGSDTIELENAIFTAIAQPTGSLLSGYFKANAAGVATDANDRVIYDTNGGQLYYDADGNGGGTAVQFAQMGGLPALTFNDFDVV